jgi:hypothetical protein
MFCDDVEGILALVAFKADVGLPFALEVALLGDVRRPEQIEFFMRLWGLWEGEINIPLPPSPPFDIDTFEAIIPLERAIKQLVPDDEPPDLGDQTAGVSNDWNQSRPDPSEVDLGDGRILVPCFD